MRKSKKQSLSPLSYMTLSGGGLLCALLYACSLVCRAYAPDMESQKVLLEAPDLWISLAAWPLTALALYLAQSHLPGRLLLPIQLGLLAVMGIALAVWGRTAPAGDSLSVYQSAQAMAMGDYSVLHPTDSYLSYYPQQLGLAAYYQGLLWLWNLTGMDLAPYHMLKILNVAWMLAAVLALYGMLPYFLPGGGDAEVGVQGMKGAKERSGVKDRAEIRGDSGEKDRGGIHFGARKLRPIRPRSEHSPLARRGQKILLLLCPLFLPLTMYSSFLYGEIPSFACFTLGAYAWARVFHREDLHLWKNPWAYALPLLLSAVLLLRKNTLILLIALGICALAGCTRRMQNKKRGLTLALYALACAAIICSSPMLLQRAYTQVSGYRLSPGVTPLSYVAMGMQESTRAAGWYNGYNFTLFQESGLQPQRADALARQAIGERLAQFAAQPGYAMDFYSRKFLSSWMDGSFAARQATLATYGGRQAWLQQVYEGSWSQAYIWFCHILLICLYGSSGVLAYISLCRNSQSEREQTPGSLLLLPYLALGGGVIFHLFWEANSRYSLPYALLLLPAASLGIALLFRPGYSREEHPESSQICEVSQRAPAEQNPPAIHKP